MISQPVDKYDVPQWQFMLAWFLLLCATLPYKARKAMRITGNVLRNRNEH